MIGNPDNIPACFHNIRDLFRTAAQQTSKTTTQAQSLLITVLWQDKTRDINIFYSL